MSALIYEKVSSQDRHIAFAPVKRAVQTWREEVYAAAQSIANETRKPIWVCASGGYDSEIACRAFLEQGISFSVLTLEHVHGTNHHDIRYAIEWCKRHGVRHDVVPFDAVRFLQRDIDRYAEKYVAIHPFRYLQIYLMERVEERGGYAVLASGEQLYQASPESRSWSRFDMYLPLSNGTAVPLMWCKDSGVSHEPYFHFRTPELCLSYLVHPVVACALENPESVFRHEANAYTLKRLVYQGAWPDLEVRYKSHGFEKIKVLYEAAKERLRARHMSSYVPVHVSVVDFEKQLRGI